MVRLFAWAVLSLLTQARLSDALKRLALAKRNTTRNTALALELAVALRPLTSALARRTWDTAKDSAAVKQARKGFPAVAWCAMTSWPQAE